MGWFTDIKLLFINPDSVECEKQKTAEDEKHKKNVLEEDTRHEDITAKEVLRHKNAVIDIESNAVCVKPKSKDETTTTTPPDGSGSKPTNGSSSLMGSNSSNSNASVNPNEIKLEGVATATRAPIAVGGRRTKRKNHVKKRKNTKRIR